MKLILDFDDTLFHNTTRFKERMYACLESKGVSRSVAEEYYKIVRVPEFSLKDFIQHLLVGVGKESEREEVYEDIMAKCREFVDDRLMNIVKALGKENCYLVTNGDGEFQQEKVKRSGVSDFFGKVLVVPSTKKEVLADICEQYKNEKIIFVDNRALFIDDIDMKRCPNLKTILYDENGFAKLSAEVARV